MIFLEHQANVIMWNAIVGIITGTEESVETTVDVNYKVDGVIYPILSAGTQLSNLTGSIPDDYQAVYTLYVTFNEVTAQHVLSVSKSDNFHKSTYLKMKDVVINDGDKAPIAYVIVLNETGATFDGNVTLLDAAGVTTTIINAYGFVGM